MKNTEISKHSKEWERAMLSSDTERAIYDLLTDNKIPAVLTYEWIKNASVKIATIMEN